MVFRPHTAFDKLTQFIHTFFHFIQLQLQGGKKTFAELFSVLHGDERRSDVGKARY